MTDAASTNDDAERCESGYWFTDEQVERVYLGRILVDRWAERDAQRGC